MVKVFIIGAGRRGTELLDRLIHLKDIKIIGMADVNPRALGMSIAELVGIPVFTIDPIDALLKHEVDLVFDLTGDPEFGDRLLNLPNRIFNVVNSKNPLPILGRIKKLDVEDDQIKKRVKENRIISEVSRAISLSKTSDQIFEKIVNAGMMIAEMPLGSLSIYNSVTKELFLVSAKGFSTEFYQNTTYKVRNGGLNEFILSKKTPVLIPDITESSDFINPILLREEIRSLIAIPINSDKGPVGILYVDDFYPRNFSKTILEPLTLLADIASISIQKQQAYEQIKALSIRDPVTGLYNRKYLNEIMAAELKRAFILGRPLSIILIEIDHFEQINTRFQNIDSDYVLKEITSLFKPILRRYDTFCRLEGNKLLLLMADTDEDGVKFLTERLLGTTSSSTFLPDGYNLTCSIGINCLKGSEFPRPSLDDLLNLANQALYEAKRLGGNQAFVYNPNLFSHPTGS
jgi:diguanylate cyclase (GGDEF)-like protein